MGTSWPLREAWLGDGECLVISRLFFFILFTFSDRDDAICLSMCSSCLGVAVGMVVWGGYVHSLLVPTSPPPRSLDPQTTTQTWLAADRVQDGQKSGLERVLEHCLAQRAALARRVCGR